MWFNYQSSVGRPGSRVRSEAVASSSSSGKKTRASEASAERLPKVKKWYNRKFRVIRLIREMQGGISCTLVLSYKHAEVMRKKGGL